MHDQGNARYFPSAVDLSRMIPDQSSPALENSISNTAPQSEGAPVAKSKNCRLVFICEHLSLGLLPSEGDDVALGFRKFDADLVDLAGVLGGVALFDYLLQGAVGL